MNNLFDEERAKIIGENITIARKKKGLTQGELGKQCEGISQPMISAYEKGKRSPNILEMVKIARVLGVSIDWLCSIEEESKAITPLQWLEYFDELVNNSPTFDDDRMIKITNYDVPKGSYAKDIKTIEFDFDNTYTRTFFEAYCHLCGLREYQHTPNEDYIRFRRGLFEKIQDYFKPGFKVVTTGAAVEGEMAHFLSQDDELPF